MAAKPIEMPVGADEGATPARPPKGKALSAFWRRRVAGFCCGLYNLDEETLMIENTEEDLGIQGFSARHPVGRFFLHQATENEYRKANFRSWGKTIRFPIIIVIAGDALLIIDYVSATTFLGTEDQSTTDQASFDPAVLIGWCLPAIVSLLFFVFTFTRYYDWRTYKKFLPIVVLSSMVFHVLPIFVSSPAGGDDGSGCEGESELLAAEQLAVGQGLAQIAAEQGAWYVSKSFFYGLCVAFYSTYLPITLMLFCALNGLYFAKTNLQWEQLCRRTG